MKTSLGIQSNVIWNVSLNGWGLDFIIIRVKLVRYWEYHFHPFPPYFEVQISAIFSRPIQNFASTPIFSPKLHYANVKIILKNQFQNRLEQGWNSKKPSRELRALRRRCQILDG